MASPVPQISISLAPPEEIPEEPYSPFSSTLFAMSLDDDDAFRPKHLLPPLAVASPRFPRQLSPLRPRDSPRPVSDTGLGRERFEAMLKASKERSAAAGASKAADFRREIALKTHKSKQLERRALFLAKVRAPPSPSAVALPKTPPESPAIFHYTLPSPGLNSPLAIFDALSDDSLALHSIEPWIEQVDFRLLEDMQSKSQSESAIRAKFLERSRSMPSLDQISAHLSLHGHVSSLARPERSPMRLPAFLQLHSREPPRSQIPTDVAIDSPMQTEQSLPIDVGRLQMPVCSSYPELQAVISVDRHTVPPASLESTMAPGLQITTTIIPQSTSSSYTQLSERDLSFLASRTRTAQDMLLTLKRRTYPSEQGLSGCDQEEEERKERRHSAPGEMKQRERSGFSHPVLAMPGGF